MRADRRFQVSDRGPVALPEQHATEPPPQRESVRSDTGIQVGEHVAPLEKTLQQVVDRRQQRQVDLEERARRDPEPNARVVDPDFALAPERTDRAANDLGVGGGIEVDREAVDGGAEPPQRVDRTRGAFRRPEHQGEMLVGGVAAAPNVDVSQCRGDVPRRLQPPANSPRGLEHLRNQHATVGRVYDLAAA